MGEMDLSTCWKDIVRAAREVSFSYAKYGKEDIAQAIALDMIEYPYRYNIGGSLFFKALKKAGYRYCQDQMSRELRATDQYTYSAEEVKALLYEFYEPSNWPNGCAQPSFKEYDGDIDGFAQDVELWAENTKIFIDMFDIQRAFGKLRPAHQKVIKKKYRDGLSLTKTQQDTHTDAVRLLTYFINENSAASYGGVPWDYEGPGARRAMSNARAQELTNTGY